MEDPRPPDPDEQDQHDPGATQTPDGAAPGVGATDEGAGLAEAPEPEEPG
jgi:hypothetical protein